MGHSMHTISIVSPSDLLVEVALSQVSQVSPVAWAILFGGDRWSPVEYVAIALNEHNIPVGMATLAPHDELGGNGPQLIGVWTHPASRRSGIGTTLVTALAHKSMEVYGKKATMITITSTGHLLAASLPADVPLHIRDINMNTDFPDLL